MLPACPSEGAASFAALHSRMLIFRHTCAPYLLADTKACITARSIENAGLYITEARSLGLKCQVRTWSSTYPQTILFDGRWNTKGWWRRFRNTTLRPTGGVEGPAASFYPYLRPGIKTKQYNQLAGLSLSKYFAPLRW